MNFFLFLLIVNLILTLKGRIPRIFSKEDYYKATQEIEDRYLFAQKFANFDILDLAKALAAAINAAYLYFYVTHFFMMKEPFYLFGIIFFTVIHIYSIVNALSVKEFKDTVDYKVALVDFILVILELIFLIIFAAF